MAKTLGSVKLADKYLLKVFANQATENLPLDATLEFLAARNELGGADQAFTVKALSQHGAVFGLIGDNPQTAAKIISLIKKQDQADQFSILKAKGAAASIAEAKKAKEIIDIISEHPLENQRVILTARGKYGSGTAGDLCIDETQGARVIQLIKAQPLDGQRDILSREGSVFGLAVPGRQGKAVIRLIQTQDLTGQREILSARSAIWGLQNEARAVVKLIVQQDLSGQKSILLADEHALATPAYNGQAAKIVELLRAHPWENQQEILYKATQGSDNAHHLMDNGQSLAIAELEESWPAHARETDKQHEARMQRARSCALGG